MFSSENVFCQNERRNVTPLEIRDDISNNYFCATMFFHSMRREFFYVSSKNVLLQQWCGLILPQPMHGVARRNGLSFVFLAPVEKLCMLCERGHVPCHTFCLPPSHQSETIPR